MSAPAGAHVRLYVDTRMPIERGDIIETQTGRRYLVESRRMQERGKHAGTRQHLEVTVLEHGLEIPGARVIPIRWYSRGRR